MSALLAAMTAAPATEIITMFSSGVSLAIGVFVAAKTGKGK
ncbi:hypothetical protein FACS1894216_20020 [Synergistales bacterium]|nr:hypothetical protein FACS1894216_20020 [Synergistales bacterium]